MNLHAVSKQNTFKNVVRGKYSSDIRGPDTDGNLEENLTYTTVCYYKCKESL